MHLLKEEYNSMLSKQKKAAQWLDSPKRTSEEVEKNFSRYLDILRALNSYIWEMKKVGKYPTSDEMLEGFK